MPDHSRKRNQSRASISSKTGKNSHKSHSSRKPEPEVKQIRSTCIWDIPGDVPGQRRRPAVLPVSTAVPPTAVPPIVSPTMLPEQPQQDTHKTDAAASASTSTVQSKSLESSAGHPEMTPAHNSTPENANTAENDNEHHSRQVAGNSIKPVEQLQNVESGQPPELHSTAPEIAAKPADMSITKDESITKDLSLAKAVSTEQQSKLTVERLELPEQQSKPSNKTISSPDQALEKQTGPESKSGIVPETAPEIVPETAVTAVKAASISGQQSKGANQELSVPDQPLGKQLKPAPAISVVKPATVAGQQPKPTNKALSPSGHSLEKATSAEPLNSAVMPQQQPEPFIASAVSSSVAHHEDRNHYRKWLPLLILLLLLAGVGADYFFNSDETVQVAVLEKQEFQIQQTPVIEFEAVKPKGNDTVADERVSQLPATEISLAGLEKSAISGIRMISHVVVKGDTLWDIAEAYLNNPFRYPELAQRSKIKNPDLIYPGDIIQIHIKIENS